MSNYLLNPKTAGSFIIDIVPQSGMCPLACEHCWFNSPKFFRERTSLLPAVKETQGKLCRINTWNDSNHNKNLVLQKTKKYRFKFYNTSVPDFKNLAPCVFTINGRYTNEAFLSIYNDINNLAMVRFRANAWNIELMKRAIDYYCNTFKIPFTITPMRYSNKTAIPEHYWNKYIYHKHIINSYWLLRTQECAELVDIGQTIGGPLVDLCGTLTDQSCKTCGRCLACYSTWYHQHKNKRKLPWE